MFVSCFLMMNYEEHCCAINDHISIFPTGKDKKTVTMANERFVTMSQNKTILQRAVLSGSLVSRRRCHMITTCANHVISLSQTELNDWVVRCPNINMTDDGGGTVLHEAVIFGNLDIIELLLSFKEINVNVPRKYGIR